MLIILARALRETTSRTNAWLRKNTASRLILDDEVPVRLGEIEKIGSLDDACTVHQDVECRKRLPRLNDDAGDGCAVGHVGGDARASTPESVNLCSSVVGRKNVDGYDVSACSRKRKGHTLAESARCPRDDSDFAVELESIEDCVHGHSGGLEHLEKEGLAKLADGCGVHVAKDAILPAHRPDERRSSTCPRRNGWTTAGRAPRCDHERPRCAWIRDAP